MKLLSTLLLVVTLSIYAAPIEDSNVVTDDGIQVFLTNERGDPQTTFFFAPGQKTAEEVVFRHSVSIKRSIYSSWVLEITEPKEGLSYRMAFDGPLPFLIHWDGMFDNERGVVPNRRYFLRLLLVTQDKHVFSSPFSFFSSEERTLDVGVHAEKVDVEVAKLFVHMSGALHSVQAKTATYSSTVFPNIDGDLSVYLKDHHHFGMRFDVSSNIFNGWNYDPSGNVVRYSDLSVSYRYRLAGTPPHRPQLPYIPPYARGGDKQIDYEASLFGASFNLEVGGKVFNTLVSGQQDQMIARELPGQLCGPAFTVNTDRAMGSFRGYFNADVGASLFIGGRINVIGLGAKVVYDRWESVAPGLVVNYLLMSGTPDQTALPGVTSLSANILFTGFTVLFKIS